MAIHYMQGYMPSPSNQGYSWVPPIAVSQPMQQSICSKASSEQTLNLLAEVAVGNQGGSKKRRRLDIPVQGLSRMSDESSSETWIPTVPWMPVQSFTPSSNQLHSGSALRGRRFDSLMHAPPPVAATPPSAPDANPFVYHAPEEDARPTSPAAAH